MSSKENAAISQLLALLEARYALRVLWALRDGHAQTFRLLQDSVGGITPNTLNTRIKELRVLIPSSIFRKTFRLLAESPSGPSIRRSRSSTIS